MRNYTQYMIRYLYIILFNWKTFLKNIQSFNFHINLPGKTPDVHVTRKYFKNTHFMENNPKIYFLIEYGVKYLLHLFHRINNYFSSVPEIYPRI